MDIRNYQSESYDPENAATAKHLADEAGHSFDSGDIENALKLWKQALELKPPLRIEATVLAELADALSEWFKPISSEREPPWALPLERLEWMEKTLIRLRELLNVPDPFDIALDEGWHEKGQELIFDPNTYFREDEKEEPRNFVNWCEGLCKELRKIFPHK
jgi:hypothetical protein